MAQTPLDGLKVLDFSTQVAGPYAARMLADLGADVMKVEPPAGDPTRRRGLRTGDMSGYYLQQNVGKRTICLDLEARGARDLVLQLAQASDLMIESFKPGTLDRLGLGWGDLKTVNPKLVMVSITGFGQTGPDRDRAVSSAILHAETGLTARQAQVSGGPAADLAVSMAETVSGLHGLVGALAALMMAQRTGHGQHIDLPMIDAVLSADDYANFALDGAWPRESETAIWIAPAGGRIVLPGSLDWLWEIFSTHDGLEDRTAPGADVTTRITARRDAIAAHLLSFRSIDALTQRLNALGIPWGRVRTFGPDSLDQPSLAAHGALVDIEDETGINRRTVQSPYRFSNAQSGIGAGAPAAHRGAHNHEALADWLGLGDAAIEALHTAGVLVAGPSGRESQSAAVTG